jgi:hypothetical protein
MADTDDEIVNFPLYESLLNMLDPKQINKDLPKKDKEFFVKHMPDIDQEGKELIYALIIIHSRKNKENVDTINLPYKGVFQDVGVLEFNFNTFPSPLKHILHKFMVMHMNRMEADTRYATPGDPNMVGVMIPGGTDAAGE